MHNFGEYWNFEEMLLHCYSSIDIAFICRMFYIICTIHVLLSGVILYFGLCILTILTL
jgi:hypothetical protein